MNSSSSSKQHRDESLQKSAVNTFGHNSNSNCLLLLSSPFPFPPQLFKPPSKPDLQEALHIFHNFHNSIVSTADRCFSLLHALASKTPVLHNVFSSSSHFHNFFQVHCRKNRNLDSLFHHNFAAILPGDSVAGIVVANGILNFLNIYNTLLVVRLVLTWFPNSPPAIVSPLSTLCDPYLNIFRGIIPPLGGTLDLSPILAFLVLNAFTSTAAALPAEIPQAGASQEIPSPSTVVSCITTTQNKWMRRLSGNKSKSSSDGI